MPEPASTVHAASSPRVWVLLGEGAGGNAQMLQLAEALGWPYSAKQMRYNPLNHLPNPVIGASSFTLARARSDSLEPPWPDLVIGASRRSAPVARWIKKQSGGHTRLVHLLHTQSALHHFDLVVTLPQYRLPERANVLHNTLPLNTLDHAKLTQAGEYLQPRLADLPRPWTAVLVGGNSSSYRLDTETAARLGRRANAVAGSLGGSLLVTTSPRTPEAAVTAVFAAIDCPAYKYRWRRNDPDNPYSGFLALADRFIVTADSASLPAEACAAGKPVELFDWQPKPGLTGRIPLGWSKPLHQFLVYWGWLKPRRDFSAFHRALAAGGLIGAASPSQPVPDDLARTVARIREVMSRKTV